MFNCFQPWDLGIGEVDVHIGVEQATKKDLLIVLDGEGAVQPAVVAPGRTVVETTRPEEVNIDRLWA